MGTGITKKTGNAGFFCQILCYIKPYTKKQDKFRGKT